MSAQILSSARLLLVGLVASIAGCTAGDEAVPALGTLERDRIEIAADASEPVVRILVDEGTKVAAGDVLAVLDQARATVALRRAQASELVARSALAEAEQGPRQQQIARARSRLQAADAALKTARYEYDRELVLLDRRLVSRSTVDVAEGRFEEATARQSEAAAALDELLEGSRSEAIDQARARHAAALADVENLQITLARAEIRAPVDGLVEALPFEVGERPPAGATVVVMLASGPTYARVHLSQLLRTRLRTGANAAIHLDGVAQPLPGRLRWVSSQAAFTPYFALNQNDRSRLSYVAEIDVTDTNAELPVGIPVEVTFPDLMDTDQSDD